MLHAGLAPLLAQRGLGSWSDRTSERAAVTLPPEGADPAGLGLAISPDGKTAYATFYSADVVLAVDLWQGVVRSAIDLSAAGAMLGSRPET
jgi:DNA-binding beta-propeller fold protein YncE